ncbi:MAG TPA: TadE family protein [Myxococcaceae bacterium]|nr:TadE family protein [Myxococcaceae bacterium]
MVTTRSKRRGQAAVELALGLLVFVTILLFGIHFAEIGYLSVKVTEANSSALWHATAAKMHTLPKDFGPVKSLISDNKAGEAATGIYADFDSRSSGGSATKQLLTSAQGLQVTCEAGGPSFAPVDTTGGVYENVGGMVCRAQATLQVLPLFPRSFMDTGAGGFFKKKQYQAANLTICGVNRGPGECEGRFAILLDDWGLATGAELEVCKLEDGAGCANGPFYKSTNRVYDEHVAVDGSAEALAKESVGSSPISPGTFFHSSMLYKDNVPGGEGTTTWETSPGEKSPTDEYDKSYSKRQKCWLGLKCPN